MTRAGLCLIVGISLAACGGASKSSTETMPPPPGPAPVEEAGGDVSCQQAVDGMFAVTAAQEPPDLRTRATKVFVNRCGADAWSAETRACMAAVKVPEDGDRCEKMLTAEQKRELADELSRELDAAGVKPDMESGKPRPKERAMEKEQAENKAPERAPEKAPAKAKSPAPARPKPASKPPAPGRAADPCEGGE